MRWWPARKPPAPEPPRPGPTRLLGPAHVLTDAVDASGYVSGDPEHELARLVEAVGEVDAFLTGLGIDSRFSDVMATQNAILHDLTWLRAATHAITEGAGAPLAVSQAFGQVSALFDSIPNSTLRERGTDVRSMARLVRSALVGVPMRRPEPTEASVWVMSELDAVTAMQVSSHVCLGIVTVRDFESGHGVEVANKRGFTVLTGRHDADDLAEGAIIDVSAARDQGGPGLS